MCRSNNTPITGGVPPFGGDRDRLTIAGAGVAGLCAAVALTRAGVPVRVLDAAPDPRITPPEGASWLAGGMLAPFCEGEIAPPEVVAMGQSAADWWARLTPVTRGGTLVVAPPRDWAELERFAAATTGHRWINGAEIAALEPGLAGRFRRALYFETEAHLTPRDALLSAIDWLISHGVEVEWNTAVPNNDPAPIDVDTRGYAAGLDDLRPVRGEMVELCTDEITLHRPVRMLHPRTPIYLVPRGNGRVMVGATMVENAHCGPITLRATMELLGAAFALHPAFAEARLIRTATGLRPAFADNIPAISWKNGRYHINGMYRHGFLCAPALAEELAQTILSTRITRHAG